MDYAYEALDRGYLPDFVVRRAIRLLLRERLSTLAIPSYPHSYEKYVQTKLEYVRSLKTKDIAIETDKANEQHYEVDTDFMLTCMGARAKYSCCLYEKGIETIDEAEVAMLESYCIKAKLQDGQDVLDLGCGWGSLCLFLAEKYPNSRIKALSNSKTQKLYIDSVAKSKGFKNLEVFTGDVKTYDFPASIRFDRVLSIEMFEHMKNYSLLFQKVSTWLRTSGESKVFIHIFCHRTTPYHFEQDDGWMAKNFFSGGTMPCHDLFLHFQQHVSLDDMWWINGNHYAKTCEAWLKKQDSLNVGNRSVQLLRQDAKKKGVEELEGEKTFYRFRVFYLACAELFAMHGGEEWGVGHYLFTKR